MADLNKLVFFSGVNYLKRDDTLSGKATAHFTGVALEEGRLYLDHNLGYVPFVTVCAELREADIIWSTNTSPMLEVGVDDTPIYDYWVTETQLVIGVQNAQDNPITGDRDFYWVIYLDYGEAV